MAVMLQIRQHQITQGHRYALPLLLKRSAARGGAVLSAWPLTVV
jgi:hypothetical protein